MDEEKTYDAEFRTLAEFSSDWLMWMVYGGQIRYVSPAVEEITGYGPGAFVENPGLLKDIIHPEDQGAIWGEFENGQHVAHDRAIVFRIIRKDGEVRWISHRCRAVLKKDGRMEGRVSSNRDITDWKLASAELREKDRFLMAVIDGIQDPMHVIDRDYRVLLTNRRLLGLRGVSQQEIAGRKCYEVYQERDSLCEPCASREAFADGGPHALVKALPLPDGTLRYFEVYAFPLADEEGGITRVIEMTHDITEREAALAAARKMARIIEQAGEAVAIADTKGNLEYVNPVFEKISGYTAAEVLGRNPRVLKSGELPPEFYSALWETITRGDIWSGVFINKKKNGEIWHEDATIFPIRDEAGKIVNYAKIARDVTGLKKLEAQLLQSQKMESIGLLAGGVAHDFNNLLTVINGNAEMALLKIDDPERLGRYIAQIQEAGGRAGNLTSQLLAFSRKQICRPEILDLNGVVASMDRMARRLIGEDIELKTVLTEYLPKIKADATQLDQILVNLLVNARDALNEVKTPDFHKKITVETGRAFLDSDYVSNHPGSCAGPHVFFAVSDNGCGMDEETRLRIFEPFFTTKEKHKGTGLGLSTVYGVVKQNGGLIYVYSEPDRGATFKIYWPAADEENAPSRRNDEEGEALRGSETILVVEDDNGVRDFACESLSSLGYAVYSAENGRLAVELIRGGSVTIDLIMTDVIMPEMGGRECVEKARELQPGIRALYASGYTDNHIVRDGMLEPGIHFLHKPYSLRELALAVRRALDKSEK